MTAHPTNMTSYSRLIVTGWNKEYGNIVDVKHPYAVTTRYAHVNALFVSRKCSTAISRDCDRWLDGQVDWITSAARDDSRKG